MRSSASSASFALDGDHLLSPASSLSFDRMRKSPSSTSLRPSHSLSVAPTMIASPSATLSASSSTQSLPRSSSSSLSASASASTISTTTTTTRPSHHHHHSHSSSFNSDCAGDTDSHNGVIDLFDLARCIDHPHAECAAHLLSPCLLSIAPLALRIVSHRMRDDAVFYVLQITHVPSAIQWTVERRFRQFHALHQQVKSTWSNAVCDALPPFPERESKWLVDHSHASFATMRAHLLQNYMQGISNIPAIRMSAPFVHCLFMQSPHDSIAEHSLLSSILEPRFGMATPPLRGMSTNASTNTSSSATEDRPSRSLSRSPSPSPASAPSTPSPSTPTPSMIVMVTVPRTVFAETHILYQINVRVDRLEYGRWDDARGRAARGVSHNSKPSASLPSPSTTSSATPLLCTTFKRFQDFYDLDQRVREHLQICAPAALRAMPMLAKRRSKLFHDHFSPRFVEKRRLTLEVYLQQLRALPMVMRSPIVLTFLGVYDA